MCIVINGVCLKKLLSNWVFTAMQSVHIRMNSSLSPSPKKILDPPMLQISYVQPAAQSKVLCGPV